MMIVLDVETTGLTEPEAMPLNMQPEIIEFAAVKLDPDNDYKQVDSIEFFCKASKPLSAKITQITGLTDADLADAETFPAHYNKLVDFFIGTRHLLAHNVSFDRNLLRYALMRMDKLLCFPWPPNHICTVEKTYHFNNRRMKLVDLHQKLFNEEMKTAHRAMADVEALARCVRALAEKGLIL